MNGSARSATSDALGLREPGDPETVPVSRGSAWNGSISAPGSEGRPDRERRTLLGLVPASDDALGNAAHQVPGGELVPDDRRRVLGAVQVLRREEDEGEVDGRTGRARLARRPTPRAPRRAPSPARESPAPICVTVAPHAGPRAEPASPVPRRQRLPRAGSPAARRSPAGCARLARRIASATRSGPMTMRRPHPVSSSRSAGNPSVSTGPGHTVCTMDLLRGELDGDAAGKRELCVLRGGVGPRRAPRPFPPPRRRSRRAKARRARGGRTPVGTRRRPGSRSASPSSTRSSGSSRKPPRAAIPALFTSRRTASCRSATRPASAATASVVRNVADLRLRAGLGGDGLEALPPAGHEDAAPPVAGKPPCRWPRSRSIPP